MSVAGAPVLIDGIPCFSPAVAGNYDDYPEGGFDLTAQVVEKSFWVRSRNRLFRHLVLANRAAAPITRLLDVGCGTGDFVRTLADVPGLSITGSEIYVKGLGYAKKTAPGVNFIQLDIEHDRIDAQFDVIGAFDVIEHIGDDAAALANMAAMVAAGGRVIVSVPQHRFMWSQLDEIVKHKRRYTRAVLRRRLAEAGLTVEFCTSFVFFLFPFMLVTRLLDKGTSQASDEAALGKRVTLPPMINRVFDLAMRIDEALIARGVSLPWGGTLVAVAVKEPGA